MHLFPAFLMALLISLSLISPVHGSGVPTDDNDWSLRTESNGVRIYTRNLDNSSINAFRAETTLAVPLENVMAVMSVAGSCVEWVHQCSESFPLELDGDSYTDRHAYSVNSMPWPASDRDYVLRIKTHADPDTGDIEMNMHAVTGKKPEKNGHIRIEHSYTVYQFSRTDDNETRMVWFQHTEPGGSLPSWLVNKLSTDLPYNSLRQLQEVALEDRYRNHEILYDDDGQIIGVRKKDQPDDGEQESRD